MSWLLAGTPSTERFNGKARRELARRRLRRGRTSRHQGWPQRLCRIQRLARARRRAAEPQKYGVLRLASAIHDRFGVITGGREGRGGMADA
jgi:hypothetical protein